MDAMKTVKGWVREFIDVAILVIAVGVVAQIIFGSEVPFFSGITNNLMDFIKSLGSNGVVGLIALFVIVWVFTKNKTQQPTGS
jgi:H+/gluconate symporter-like permease